MRTFCYCDLLGLNNSWEKNTEKIYLYPNSLAAAEVVKKDMFRYLDKGEYAAVENYLTNLPLDSAEAYYHYAHVRELLHNEGVTSDYLQACADSVAAYPDHKRAKYAASLVFDDTCKREDWAKAIESGVIFLETYKEGQEPLELCLRLADIYESTQQLDKALSMLQLFILNANKFDTRLETIKARATLLSPSGKATDYVLKRLVAGTWQDGKCHYDTGVHLGCFAAGTCKTGDCAHGAMCSGQYPCSDCYEACVCENCEPGCDPPPTGSYMCQFCDEDCTKNWGCSCIRQRCNCTYFPELGNDYCSTIPGGVKSCRDEAYEGAHTHTCCWRTNPPGMPPPCDYSCVPSE